MPAACSRCQEGVSFETGASLLMTYGTTIHGLKDRGHIKAGETMLVLGAAGASGRFRHRARQGLWHRASIAAVSSEEKAAAAREAGADDVVIDGRPPFDKDQSKALADAFKAACGPNGADIVYDIVGGDYSEPAVRAIAWEGRFLVVGFPAGIARLPLNLTLLSPATSAACSGAFTAREPQKNAEHVAELFDLLRGEINPASAPASPRTRRRSATPCWQTARPSAKSSSRWSDVFRSSPFLRSTNGPAYQKLPFCAAQMGQPTRRSSPFLRSTNGSGGPPKAGRKGNPSYRTFVQTCVLHSGQTTQPFTSSAPEGLSETVAA
jgi:hypothetical protein